MVIFIQYSAGEDITPTIVVINDQESTIHIYLLTIEDGDLNLQDYNNGRKL